MTAGETEKQLDHRHANLLQGELRETAVNSDRLLRSQ